MIKSKQHIEETQYYTDFADLEVSYDNTDEFELYDSSDEAFIERDHLDIMKFCKDLDNTCETHMDLLSDEELSYIDDTSDDECNDFYNPNLEILHELRQIREALTNTGV